jgi:FkbM family methyltransferase
MLPLLIDGPGFNAMVRAKHGLMLFNRNDVYIGRSIGKYGEFSEGEIALFSQLCRPGDVVVEVGANIGTHTLPIAKMVGRDGRIHAFEPQRIVFQTLCANMAMNSITNVECHYTALSHEPSTLLIPDIAYELEGNYGGVEVTRFGGGAPVPMTRMDDVIALPRCRLIKIDVEGMEHDVISGARSTIAAHRPFLYVENDRIEKSDALIDLIGSMDYGLFWHTPYMYNPQNYARDTEDIFPGVISINMICIPAELRMEMDGFLPVQCGQHPMAAL